MYKSSILNSNSNLVPDDISERIMQPIPMFKELMREPVSAEIRLMSKKIRYPNKNRKAMRELLVKTTEDIALG
jgi:hypothetical protein